MPFIGQGKQPFTMRITFIYFRVAAEPDRAADRTLQPGDDHRAHQHQDLRRYHELSGVRIPGKLDLVYSCPMFIVYSLICI